MRFGRAGGHATMAEKRKGWRRPRSRRQAALAKEGVAGSLGGHEPATGPFSGWPRGRGDAARPFAVRGAAEGFSGPAQRFEPTYRWAGENFHWPLSSYDSRALGAWSTTETFAIMDKDPRPRQGRPFRGTPL
jgi:hypothetical protein